MSATLFVKHKVGDYDHWKRGYDALGPYRQESSVLRASVHRDINDPTTIVVTHTFDNAQAIMTFVNSDRLKEAMADAGVVSAPEFWFADDVEQTTH